MMKPARGEPGFIAALLVRIAGILLTLAIVAVFLLAMTPGVQQTDREQQFISWLSVENVSVSDRESDALTLANQICQVDPRAVQTQTVYDQIETLLKLDDAKAKEFVRQALRYCDDQQ